MFFQSKMGHLYIFLIKEQQANSDLRPFRKPETLNLVSPQSRKNLCLCPSTFQKLHHQDIFVLPIPLSFYVLTLPGKPGTSRPAQEPGFKRMVIIITTLSLCFFLHQILFSVRHGRSLWYVQLKLRNHEKPPGTARLWIKFYPSCSSSPIQDRKYMQ